MFASRTHETTSTLRGDMSDATQHRTTTFMFGCPTHDRSSTMGGATGLTLQHPQTFRLPLQVKSLQLHKMKLSAPTKKKHRDIVASVLLRLCHQLIYISHSGQLYVDDFIFSQSAKILPVTARLLFLFFQSLNVPLSWKNVSCPTPSTGLDGDSISVKTTHERCGPFSLVVLSQRRGRVTTSSGPTLSETLSSKNFS